MSTFERHYSVPELVELWNLNRATITRLFRDEPGVIALGGGSRRTGRSFVRRYFTLRIPESVAERVYARMLGSRQPR